MDMFFFFGGGGGTVSAQICIYAHLFIYALRFFSIYLSISKLDLIFFFLFRKDVMIPCNIQCAELFENGLVATVSLVLFLQFTWWYGQVDVLKIKLKNAGFYNGSYIIQYTNITERYDPTKKRPPSEQILADFGINKSTFF